MNDMTSVRDCEPLDLLIGARVRLKRQLLNIQQENLADAIGITKQQVHKYERGYNRLSASKIYEIAKAMREPIDYFFEGLPAPAGDELAERWSLDEQKAQAFLLTPEGCEVANLFEALPPGQLRRRFLDLMGALAAVEEDAQNGLQCGAPAHSRCGG